MRSPRLSARITLFALTFCAASSFGGEIYGTIKENGKPIAKDVEVTIKVGEAESYSKKTDEFGSYRIFVPQVGPCTLEVSYKGKTIPIPPCPIQSYTKPTRFDFVLENINGQYTLRRQ